LLLSFGQAQRRRQDSGQDVVGSVDAGTRKPRRRKKRDKDGGLSILEDVEMEDVEMQVCGNGHLCMAGSSCTTRSHQIHDRRMAAMAQKMTTYRLSREGQSPGSLLWTWGPSHISALLGSDIAFTSTVGETSLAGLKLVYDSLSSPKCEIQDLMRP